jgi:hypothetical protein
MGWQDDPVVADKPKWETDPIVAAAAQAAPPIDIQAGSAVPQVAAPSANPFSAGRYPLGRIFTIGDMAAFRQSDILTGFQKRMYKVRCTKVDYDEDRVEFNNGFTITDLMGNVIKSGPVEFDTPVQWTPAEFQIGKKWTAAFRRSQGDRTTNAYYDMKITRRETITVPAGSFDTFRIEGSGWNMTNSAQLDVNLWMVPGLNFQIKREFVTRKKVGGYGQTERHELVVLRQQTIDSVCTTVTGGRTGARVIKSNCTQ